MKKFMVLYKASSADFEKIMKSSTLDEQKKGMEAWGKWMQANQKSIVDGGAPLGKTKRVDQKGVSDAKNDIGGYSVVQADSPEAAAKIFHYPVDALPRRHGPCGYVDYHAYKPWLRDEFRGS